MHVKKSNKSNRIAKNTILLYFRMLLLMLISLYTSRVILYSLGVVDYGIYNAVGGIVSMFTMISGSLSAAISRFITYELGTENIERLKKIFSSSVTIQLVLSLFFVIIAETIGLWFLNERMNIPEERLYAANWVYQFSIVAFIINLISIPYNAAIIAHEKMSAFAYISIIEVILKLIVAWLILYSPMDKLVIYSALIMCVAIIVRLLYGGYCNKSFEECRYSFIYENAIFKKMFSFAGWNMIGATSAVLRDHGGTIILNIFCGPAVNAARAIAIQVNTAIMGFVNNFQTAINPQIIKSYASNDYDYMTKLVFQGARFSYYILLIVALPVFVNVNYILNLWLAEVPEHTDLFLRLVLIFSLSESLSGTLMNAQYATGEVKNYQIVVGGMQMLNLPISYICLKHEMIPEVVMIVSIIVSVCCMVLRLFMLKPLIHISIMKFMKDVWLDVILVTFFSSLLPLIVHYELSDTFAVFILTSLLSVLCACSSIIYIGLNEDERSWLFLKLKSFVNKPSI